MDLRRTKKIKLNSKLGWT